MRSYETDGREYFFVSRQTMETFISKKKFIEFGEYKGCLYGTSKDSIKRALKTGKTCVLKVQPEVSACVSDTFWLKKINLVSGKLPTYPSPKPTITLTSLPGQNCDVRWG